MRAARRLATLGFLFAALACTGCGSSTSPASCDPASTTLGPNGGPDTCAYGEACSADHTCHAVSNGGCSQASASGGSSWDGTDRSAPVVVSATRLGAGNVSGCPGPGETFTLDYYAPGGLTAATDFSTWRNQVWIDVDPSAGFVHPDADAGSTFDGSAVFGELKVVVCGVESVPAAVFLENDAGKTSNAVCMM